MKFHSQHAMGNCPVPLAGRRSPLPGARCRHSPRRRSRQSGKPSGPAVRLRESVRASAAAPAAAAAALYCHPPRSPLMSPGVAPIAALAEPAAASLPAREETRPAVAFPAIYVHRIRLPRTASAPAGRCRQRPGTLIPTRSLSGSGMWQLCLAMPFMRT